MSGIVDQAGRLASREELARLDYFEDLRDQYLAIRGLEARWLPKDVESLHLERETCLRLHYLMTLARALEETIQVAFRAGHVPGTAFSGRGNEAASVGAAFGLREEDWLIPMHRNCGAHLTKGHPPRNIMAQFLGRADGQTKGRDGNFHVGWRPKNITQLISHIGTMVPIAAGVAWALKREGKGRAALNFIGDGGTSTGDFHEGINLAAVHRLPLVVVIDNNQYAYKTPLEDQFACETLALKAPGYGIPGYLIDGTDVLLVYKVCAEAIERARAGGGPTLIESVTMRAEGHSVYDKYTDYVDMENFRRWIEERDPIARYDRYLREMNILGEEEIEASHARAREEAERAYQEALGCPFPEPGAEEKNVFAD